MLKRGGVGDSLFLQDGLSNPIYRMSDGCFIGKGMVKRVTNNIF